MSVLDVLIIGGGPAGLAAGIAAKTRGLRYLIVEKGALVNSLLHYPTDMVFFTTPELLEIGGMPFVSPYEKPTRQEALRYYRRVTDAYGLEIAFGETVTAVRRAGDGIFRVTSQPEAGEPRLRQAATVVVATGAYDLPNRLNVPGEDLPHVSHYFREPHPYYRRRVVIVGGKNSAAEAALVLYRSGVVGHAGPSGRSARRLDQVLGQARYREPHQGRIDSRAIFDARRRDYRRTTSCSTVRQAGARNRRTPCCS